nr:hypothetical protein CFP56_12327 [Quercus suber]
MMRRGTEVVTGDHGQAAMFVAMECDLADELGRERDKNANLSRISPITGVRTVVLEAVNASRVARRVYGSTAAHGIRDGRVMDGDAHQGGRR